MWYGPNQLSPMATCWFISQGTGVITKTQEEFKLNRYLMKTVSTKMCALFRIPCNYPKIFPNIKMAISITCILKQTDDNVIKYM